MRRNDSDGFQTSVVVRSKYYSFGVILATLQAYAAAVGRPLDPRERKHV